MIPVPEPKGQMVGVFFGGVSPEHEVSVISAMQAIAALRDTDWETLPVYIAKDGQWWSGEGLRNVETLKQQLKASHDVYPVSIRPGSGGGLTLVREAGEGVFASLRRPALTHRIDLVLPVLHGGSGENGSLQGLCETVGVAYAGSGPLAAALAMDKVAAKRWAAGFGIPQVAFEAFREAEWGGREDEMIERLISRIGLPAVVKPAGLGSSIGITVARLRDDLDAAVEEAFRYDDTVVVEQAVQNLRELNCSVLGVPGRAEASVLEEPLSGEALLSFRDKYMRGNATGKRGTKHAGMASLDRKIPAEVPESVTGQVRDLALTVFAAFGCQGVVRIDFLMDADSGAVYFNEINTMPGSLAFYLWEPSGKSFPEMLDTVLRLGLQRFRASRGRVRTYDVNLLSERDLKGLKGGKG